jgi:hypothetical protein
MSGHAPARAACVLGVFALVTASCGGGHKAAKGTTTTTTAPTTTSSTGLPANAAPLTGLPEDAARRSRPALVVKLDNAPSARPQAGLNQADIAIEEKVEDGVTRFFSIFQSQDADPVAPVRSARSTDIALVTPLNHPLFAYAGANATFQQLVNSAPLVDVGINKQPGEYRRDPKRPPAPYNLTTSTAALYRHAPAGAQPPPPLFTYRGGGAPVTSAGAAKVAGLHIEFKGVHITTVVDWGWDPAAQVWRRGEAGTAHNDAAGQQITTKNIVVEFVNYVATNQVDTSGTIVPEGKVVGAGEAWVLTGGMLVKGTWSKPSNEAVTVYADSAGSPIALTPGQTWLELPPPGTATFSALE